jgi:hypothetical protein
MPTSDPGARLSPLARFMSGLGDPDLTPWQRQLLQPLGETMSNAITDPEINAIDDAYHALGELDREAQIRALQYLIARLGLIDHFTRR